MQARSKQSFYAAVLISIILISTQYLGAINEDAGRSGFNTLKLVYSGRAHALAQAVTGISGDISGLQSNPASIRVIGGRIVSSTFMNHFVGGGGGSVQFIQPQDNNLTYAAHFSYLDFGTMDRTLVTNGDLIETGETFGAYDLIAGIAVATYISNMIDVGGALKYIHSAIDDVSASALALDLGVIHHPENERIKIGLALRNIGAQLTHYSNSKYKETLPFTYATGFTYQASNELLLLADLSKSRGQGFVGKLATEYAVHPAFDLRLGFRTNASDWKAGGTWSWTSGLSAGAGWNYRDWKIDYSISSYGDLGSVNQLTLQYHF